MSITRVCVVFALVALALGEPHLRKTSQIFDNDRTPVHWQRCGGETEITITEFDLVPDPPQKNSLQKVRFAGDYKGDADITGGKIKLDLKFDKIVPFFFELNLCNTMLGGSTCPLKPGKIDFTVGAEIPSDAPSGRVAGTIKIYNDSHKELACIAVDFYLDGAAISETVANGVSQVVKDSAKSLEDWWKSIIG